MNIYKRPIGAIVDADGCTYQIEIKRTGHGRARVVERPENGKRVTRQLGKTRHDDSGLHVANPADWPAEVLGELGRALDREAKAAKPAVAPQFAELFKF